MAKALIVVLCLERWQPSRAVARHFRLAHANRAVIREVETAREAHRYLDSTVRPHAIIVSDGAVLKPDHRNLLPKLVHYARDGGTVIFDGSFSVRVNPAPLGVMFREDWNVPWRAQGEDTVETSLNPLTRAVDSSNLVKKYGTRANWIRDVAITDALHVDSGLAKRLADRKCKGGKNRKPPGGETCKTPAAFSTVGRGRLGYIGDVAYHERTLELMSAMCFYPGSRSPRVVPGTGVPPSVDLRETKEPLAGMRPREAEVARRSLKRGQAQDEKRQLADLSKEEGNILFRQGRWLDAAEMYRTATMFGGPQPTYLSNLAAALLKVKLWNHADSAASRALIHDSNHVKALYRRALARKEMGLLDAAMSDISRLLAIEEDNAPALEEERTLRRLKTMDVGRSTSGRGKLDTGGEGTGHDVRALDIEYASDSEDYEHEGNGISCKFHNRAQKGCTYGPGVCAFRHGPDWKSVRDELGRNVCLYWLVGECRKKDGTCEYTHHADYLPPNGWWTYTARLDHLRKEFDDAVSANPLNMGNGRIRESILAEALVPPSYMQDQWMWAAVDAEAAAVKKHEEEHSGGSNDEDSATQEEWKSGWYSSETHYDLFEQVADEMGLSDYERELVMLHEMERGRFGV